jgi:hypothetical protein
MCILYRDVANPFMVEMHNLLPKGKVFQKCRPALPGGKAFLLLDRAASIGSHVSVRVVDLELRHEVIGGDGAISSNWRVARR